MRSNLKTDKYENPNFTILTNLLFKILKKDLRSLKKCLHCGIDFEEEIKDFCSNECVQLYFDRRIQKALDDDDSHTQNLS